MIRAYLFALDPTDAQAQAFRSHCGAQRYAYNFGLALIRANLDQRAAERSYGIPGDQLTPAVSWSALSLRRAWNEVKDTRAPWWAENSRKGDIRFGSGAHAEALLLPACHQDHAVVPACPARLWSLFIQSLSGHLQAWRAR